MGATRRKGGDVPQKLTSQEQARRDWLNEQRGIDSSSQESQQKTPMRMAGQAKGLGGVFGLLTRGVFGRRGKASFSGSRPRRDQATRDWIDKQRGVTYEKKSKSLGPFAQLIRGNSLEQRQRYQDRNAWIDEQIRKDRERKEAERISAANQPMTEDERRGFLNKEVESRKDIWD
tara:strand:+ start:295 stop:816 length:522 start_codon:yes stop_codon:yes gene_type:complete